MNCYLYRTGRVSDEVSLNVFQLLNKHRGDISFKDQTSKLQRLRNQTRDGYFKKCQHLRKTANLNPGDVIILLIEQDIELHWFSDTDPDGNRNVFVCTNEWEQFSEADLFYPIAFEITLNLLLLEMFSDREELLEHVHDPAKGCVLDLCRDKNEITMKLRTADLCKDCQEIVSARNVPKNVMRQIFAIFESLRSKMLYRERFSLTEEPCTIEITGRTIEFIQIEKSVKLQHLHMALYRLFMSEENGIKYKDLGGYKEALRVGYQGLKGCEDDVAKASIKKLLGNIDSTISKINACLKKGLNNDELWQFYKIDGKREMIYKITVPRNKVTYAN